ncbi:aldo/keto reductase [Actinoplanes italicus]|uniref:Aryl-alcohol dehydrogenase-like predicted oxidoreductase n=1 Tax=Actinoplanes italicus TaxID=113567 RepID=A0A2T0K8F6_9ACTN|nr:aldo/keto reductase [Actinoplanes italicus]PRX19360.1 aryl-alcohol dehydrogenase-like predicted oxidoreductase [Actinoplanes italicus]GIE30625.1 aldo/keto reductase [Actinoplanes italicus]
MTVPLRPFGRTGVKVSALALGTMMFGERGNPDHDDSVRIIHRALDAGINLVDTADVYSQGESEEIVGKALAGRRDEVFLATKFHGQIGTDPNHFGNSRRWIIRAVEDSLRRLRTDHIDLYQVHRPEEDTDFDETLGALSDLVHQGKVRYIGTSTFEPSAIVEGQWIAARRNRERVVSEQPPYSILARGVEREVLPIAQKYGLAVIPWSPLAGGWLTGRFRAGGAQPETSRGGRQPGRFEIGAPENAAKLAAVEALALLAEQSGLSLIHLALGFVLEHPAVTAPIIGPRTFEQLEAQLDAAQVRLSRDVLDEIDKIVPPGVTLSSRDQGYHPPALEPARRRRSAA